MINSNYINPYKFKPRSNKINYSMADGQYKTTHGMKVPSSIPYFSISKVITEQFHIYNDWGNDGISYDMIIGCDLMVQLDLKFTFGLLILEWYETVIPLTDPGNFLGQPDLTKCEMQ